MHDELIIVWPEDLAELGVGDVPPIVAEPYAVAGRLRDRRAREGKPKIFGKGGVLDGSRLKSAGKTLAKLGKRIVTSPIVQAGATAAIGAFAGPAGAQVASTVFGAVNAATGRPAASQAVADATLLTAPGMVPFLEELVRQAPATAPYVAPFLAAARARAAGLPIPPASLTVSASVAPVTGIVVPLAGRELSFAERYC